MTPDEKLALVLGLLSTLLLIPSIRYVALDLSESPVVALLGVASIAFALFKKNYLVAIVLIAVSLYLIDSRSRGSSKYKREIAKDVAAADARFDPTVSIDLQVANKTLIRDSPNMLNPPEPTPTLLTYPPSGSTLQEMCG